MHILNTLTQSELSTLSEQCSGTERDASQRITELQKQLRFAQLDHETKLAQLVAEHGDHLRQCTGTTETVNKRISLLEEELLASQNEKDALMNEWTEAKKQASLKIAELQRQLKAAELDHETRYRELSDQHDDHVKHSQSAALITKKHIESLEAELQGSKDELSVHLTECTQQQRISNAKIAELQTKLEKSEWELSNQIKALVNERDDLLLNNASVGEATTKRIRSLEEDLESTRAALLVSHDRIAALTAQLKESQSACERTLAQGTNTACILPHLFYLPSPKSSTRIQLLTTLAKSLPWRQSELSLQPS